MFHGVEESAMFPAFRRQRAEAGDVELAEWLARASKVAGNVGRELIDHRYRAFYRRIARPFSTLFTWRDWLRAPGPPACQPGHAGHRPRRPRLCDAQ